MMLSHPRQRHGFTLIELAIVLAIISVILGLSLSAGQTQLKIMRYTGTQRAVNDIAQAVELFRNKYGYIPCPALPNVTITNAAYGVAQTTCYDTCPAGLICPAGSTIAMGAVPFKTLNISESLQIDSWKSRISYFADRELTTTVSDAFGSIPIKDVNGNTITSGNNKAMFVVLSHGKNGHGAYSKTGVRAVCNTTKSDKENCDDDADLQDSFFNEGDIASKEFDDILAWRTGNSGDKNYDAALENVRAFASGHVNSCVADGKNRRWCWGGNLYGALGAGITHNPCNAASVTNNITNIGSNIPQSGLSGMMKGTKDVAIGKDHLCMIDTDNDLYCQGKAEFLGTNTANNAMSPVFVMANVRQVSASANHTCAVKNDDSLWCWGRNTQGQIAKNTGGAPVVSPSYVVLDNVARVSAGQDHACALKHDGTVWCWGKAANIGLTSAHPNYSGGMFYVPSQITSLKNIVQIASTSTDHNCALSGDRQVYCWGVNSNGALGMGNTTTVTDATIQAIPQARYYANTTTTTYSTHTLNNVVSIGVGDRLSCALKASGHVYCWGRNNENELAYPRYSSNETRPVLINHTNPVVKLSVGNRHFCSVDTTSTIRCWGENDFHTLALSTSTMVATGTCDDPNFTPASAVPTIVTIPNF